MAFTIGRFVDAARFSCSAARDNVRARFRELDPRRFVPDLHDRLTQLLDGFGPHLAFSPAGFAPVHQTQRPQAFLDIWGGDPLARLRRLAQPIDREKIRAGNAAEIRRAAASGHPDYESDIWWAAEDGHQAAIGHLANVAKQGHTSVAIPILENLAAIGGPAAERAVRDIEAAHRARAGYVPELGDIEDGIPAAVEDYGRRAVDNGSYELRDRLERLAGEGSAEARRALAAFDKKFGGR